MCVLDMPSNYDLSDSSDSASTVCLRSDNNNSKTSRSAGPLTEPPPSGSPPSPPADMQIVDRRVDEATAKRVRFADAEGLDLVHIRELPNGSGETPPDIHPELILNRLNSLSLGDAEPSEPTFVLDFTQPVSDFTSFMKRVERGMVCLESASVRVRQLVGTIKVRNLDFHKSVFVRLTSDDWKTSKDVPASYVSNVVSAPARASASAAATATHHLIDTFSFTYDMPASLFTRNSQSVQFAVCFRCQGSEFWDNNDGRNYKIFVHNKGISSSSGFSDFRLDTQTYRKGRSPGGVSGGGININWSEFAIWNHTDNDFTPYW